MAKKRRRRPPGARAPRASWKVALVLGMVVGGLAAGFVWGFGAGGRTPRPDLEKTLDGGRRRDLPTPKTPTVVPPPAVVSPSPPPAPRPTGPRVAIVIDDLGRSLADLETLASLEVPLTYAVLPFENRTPEVVEALQRRHAEFLLHLPMEAKGGNNPGPGALRADMSASELAAATRLALAAVPGARGVNNHMGSAIASRRDAIRAVLEVVSAEGLYFLDSRTSADTEAYRVARELGVPAAERQVFLDTDRDPTAIEAQFDHLLALARERGEAVAIAHPYPETLELLARAVPAARAAGIDFVTASSLLTPG